VLLKNRFSLLPKIFDEGNKIVNSVNAVAKLFLTKNFLVIIMTLFSLFLAVEFPLTPRRVSLLNMFGIGIPALILALLNRNVGKSRAFIRDVLSYTLLSSSLMVLSVYSALFAYLVFFPAAPAQGAMVMMTVMVTLFVANFVIIALEAGSRSPLIWIFGIGLLGIYFLFAAFTSDFFPYSLIKTFYEIETVMPATWLVIVPAAIVSLAAIFTGQAVRKWTIRG
jgi:cation-transporting ATPase E